MKEYLAGIRNSFRFSGRTTRREFWMFYLVNLILSCLIPFLTGMIIGFVGGTSDAAIAVTYLYLLFMLLPAVSISVRRLHDIGRTGWWVAFGLLPVLGTIVLLVFLATRGMRMENKYGPEPIRDALA